MANPFFKKKEDTQMTGVTRWIRQILNQPTNGVISPYLAESGQRLHKDIEHFFKHHVIVNNSREFKHFLTFAEDHTHLEPYFIEELIQSDIFKWRGIVDIVYVDGCEQFWLYDWKRSRGHMYDVTTFPTEDLSSIEFSLLNSYILQLNIYRIILESEYDMNIQGMKLIFLHPSLESYRVMEIPRLSSKIEKELVNVRFNQLD